MNEEYFDDYIDSDEAEPSSGDFTDAEIIDEVRKSVGVKDLIKSEELNPAGVPSYIEGLSMIRKIRV